MIATSPAVLVACADAVVRTLNADPEDNFGQQFEAKRSYADWELAFEDDSDDRGRLHVDVVPVSQLPTELETRGSVSYTPSIDVVVRFALGQEFREANGEFTLDQLDALVLFVQRIAEFFTADRFGDAEDFAWDADTGTKIMAAYKPSHLRQHHQFTGIVRIPFTASRRI